MEGWTLVVERAVSKMLSFSFSLLLCSWSFVTSTLVARLLHRHTQVIWVHWHADFRVSLMNAAGKQNWSFSSPFHPIFGLLNMLRLFLSIKRSQIIRFLPSSLPLSHFILYRPRNFLVAPSSIPIPAVPSSCDWKVFGTIVSLMCRVSCTFPLWLLDWLVIWFGLLLLYWYLHNSILLVGSWLYLFVTFCLFLPLILLSLASSWLTWLSCSAISASLLPLPFCYFGERAYGGREAKKQQQSVLKKSTMNRIKKAT